MGLQPPVTILSVTLIFGEKKLNLMNGQVENAENEENAENAENAEKDEKVLKCEKSCLLNQNMGKKPL